MTGVTRRFGDLVAVNDVTLNVGHGEIVGLLGHNGAGKTTLIRVINGLLPPDTGTIRVLGRDPLTEGQLVRRSTGVLTEYPALDEYLSPVENLSVYAAINGVPPRVATERIDRLTHQLGLYDKRDVTARDLSAGLKQRVALARAMVHDPGILLLDEPTTNMDPVAARAVRELIQEAAHTRGRTVLLSTHNLSEAESLCDRIGIMRDGRLLSFGSPGQLRRSLGESRTVRIETDEAHLDTIKGALEGQAAVRQTDVASVEIVGGAGVPALVAMLVGAGVDIYAVWPVEPTLEDLYLHLHDEAPAKVMS